MSLPEICRRYLFILVKVYCENGISSHFLLNIFAEIKKRKISKNVSNLNKNP